MILKKVIMYSDPVESYFECIYCDIYDGTCISKCVEILRDDES